MKISVKMLLLLDSGWTDEKLGKKNLSKGFAHVLLLYFSIILQLKEMKIHELRMSCTRHTNLEAIMFLFASILSEYSVLFLHFQ